MEKQKFYMTTAIAYASKKPHFGNTYEAIMTDALALQESLFHQSICCHLIHIAHDLINLGL